MSKSGDVVADWIKKIDDIKNEIAMNQQLQEELKAQIQEQDRLIAQEQSVIKRKKVELRDVMDKAVRSTDELEALCTVQSEKKAAVHKHYTAALDEYERLHDLVNKIKAKENITENRTDYEEMLRKESCDWSELQYALHMKLQKAQADLKEQRSRQSKEVADLEGKIREAEMRLHADRVSRDSATKTARQRGASRQASSVGLSHAEDENTRSLPRGGILVSKQSKKRDYLGDRTNN